MERWCFTHEQGSGLRAHREGDERSGCEFAEELEGEQDSEAQTEEEEEEEEVRKSSPTS